MHLNEIGTRRTLAGAPIVYGMHALGAKFFSAKRSGSANVRFARFIYLDSPVELRLVQRTQTLIRLTLGQGAVFVALGL
jgi:hypothetical protein